MRRWRRRRRRSCRGRSEKSEPRPGTNGVMKTQSIAAKAGVGAVELAVTDGDRALRFYRDYVGLTPLASGGPEIRLGAAGRELVVLYPDAERPVVPRTSGLYHLALLVPDRRGLGAVAARPGAPARGPGPTHPARAPGNH